MPTPKVRIRGQRKLARAFRQLSKGTRERVKAEIRERTKRIKRDAQREAPVDEGVLRRTIRRRLLKRGMVGVVFAEQDYARFVEFPTERTEAQPFLFPAFEEHVRGFDTAIKRALGAEARRVRV